MTDAGVGWPEGADRRPVGARTTTQPSGALRWVDPGDLVLDVAARVIVHEQGQEWLAEVAVSAARVVEAPPLDNLPRVVRLADATDWPTAPPRAGLALLRSLNLPT
jgi:hypothetical protein